MSDLNALLESSGKLLEATRGMQVALEALEDQVGLLEAENLRLRAALEGIKDAGAAADDHGGNQAYDLAKEALDAAG